MLQSPHNLNQVLAKFPTDCRPAAVAKWSGGFSGSQIWRLETDRGPLCLRYWPSEHPNSTQLRQIHGVLMAIRTAGFNLAPDIVRAKDRSTFVEHTGRLWELTQWMPGTPFDFPRSDIANCRPRIAAAMVALAQFHVAVSADSSNRCSSATPPGIVGRLNLLKELHAGGLDGLLREVSASGECWAELAARAAAYFQAFQSAAPRVRQLLESAANLRAPITYCLRDIHRGHILFSGEQVTGIIDFGALQPDNVACDIARLLGSTALDRPELWQTGLQSFESIRPLTADQRFLVRTYDASSVLLSGANWLRWVFEEHRDFEDRPAVLARFDEIGRRLRHLNELGSRASYPD